MNQAQLLELEEKKEDAGNDRSSSDEEQKRALERLKFVDSRLRDLQRFEDRARGQWRK